MKDPDLEEERLDAPIAYGLRTVARPTVSGGPPTTATVTAPDGTKSPLSLRPSGSGLLSGRMAATHPGIWSVDDGDHRAFAAPVRPDPEEFSDLRLTADIVGPVTKQTGGKIVWLGNDVTHPTVPAITLGTSAGNALNFPQRHAHVLTGTSTTPLLPAWLMLLLAASLLAAGWYREGRG